jgi:L-fuconolactonase
VLEKFGDDRCCCGGDWPVSLLAGSYTQTWQSYKTVLTNLLDEHRLNKVLYSNAMTFYNLS